MLSITSKQNEMLGKYAGERKFNDDETTTSS
jgi:hypothetical protein